METQRIITVTELVVLYSVVCLCDVQNFACQNHVRAVLRVGTQLFVCATGVDAPIVYYLDVSMLNSTETQCPVLLTRCIDE